TPVHPSPLLPPGAEAVAAAEVAVATRPARRGTIHRALFLLESMQRGPMLISPSSLLLFVTGAAILLAIPGPAIMYIVSRTSGPGRAAGLVSAMGIATGTLVHVAAATLGFSALLASSAIAFQFVKYLGAAYLIYLGIRVLRSGDSHLLEAASGDKKPASI